MTPPPMTTTRARAGSTGSDMADFLERDGGANEAESCRLGRGGANWGVGRPDGQATDLLCGVGALEGCRHVENPAVSADFSRCER